jgi:predicted nucleic acid-binding protein
MLIYLDNCCYNRPFDNQVQLKIRLETEAKLYIQQQIVSHSYELAWSYILDYENGLNPYDERKNRIALWKDIAVVDCISEDSIVFEAEKLQSLGLKVFDSLHIACAIYMRCDYFITTDANLLKKKVIGIEVVDPIEFIRREVKT